MFLSGVGIGMTHILGLASKIMRVHPRENVKSEGEDLGKVQNWDAACLLEVIVFPTMFRIILGFELLEVFLKRFDSLDETYSSIVEVGRPKTYVPIPLPNRSFR